MKKRTRRIFGNILFWGSLLYIVVDAFYNINRGVVPAEYWRVIGAVVLAILGVLWGMRG